MKLLTGLVLERYLWRLSVARAALRHCGIAGCHTTAITLLDDDLIARPPFGYDGAIGGTSVKRHPLRYARLSLATIALAALSFATSQGAVVQQYAGNGALNTRPFTVSQGWEVQWDASGDIFQLYLHGGAGDLVDVAANQMGSGSGASFFPKPGTYYFQVNAIGPWSLQIVHVTSGPAEIRTAPADYRGNGTTNTRPFLASGPWEVQWEASGDIFQVYVYDGGGNLVDIAANQLGAGRGASYQPRSGTYYLQVNAVGAWTLRVVSMR